MKRIGAHEFERRVAQILDESEMLSIERDGRVIGHYIPVPNGPAGNGATGPEESRHADAETRAAIERLERVLEGIYARTGMTEDELADVLDPSKPFPYDREAGG